MPKSVLVIGQAKGAKWKDGPMYSSKLWEWFATIGVSRDQAYKTFSFDALIDHGTERAKKGRVPPSGEQMKAYRPTLIANTKKLKPKLIIPVGNLAIKQVFGRNVLLEDVIGLSFELKPFGELPETTVIPLPHPSGVSLWLNAASNKERLAKALSLIKQAI